MTSVKVVVRKTKGGGGSGNWGHAGRPGMVGGSTPGSDIVVEDNGGGEAYKSGVVSSKTGVISDVPKNLLPTKSPRFKMGSIGDATTAAIRSSAYYNGEPVYLVATSIGMRISSSKPDVPRLQTYQRISATYDALTNSYSITSEVIMQ